MPRGAGVGVCTEGVGVGIKHDLCRGRSLIWCNVTELNPHDAEALSKVYFPPPAAFSQHESSGSIKMDQLMPSSILRRYNGSLMCVLDRGSCAITPSPCPAGRCV